MDRRQFLAAGSVAVLGVGSGADVRTERWKYIRTFDIKDRTKVAFEELYDLEADPHEMDNIVGKAEHAGTVERMKRAMTELEGQIR
jgi:arylsulfatase A-like enzyme